MYWHKNGKGFSLQIKNTSNQNFTIKYLLSIPLDKTLQKRTAAAVQVPITCSKQIVLNATKHER